MPTAQEIYDLLIVDPDFAVQGKKAVWTEAKQRERQHKNNQAALSMAWEDSPTLKSLIEFLRKADEEPEVPESSSKTIFYGPLRAIMDAIAAHVTHQDDLPWSGPDRVGTLASLIGPHVRALNTILQSSSAGIVPIDSPLHAIRQEVNEKVLNIGPEDSTAEFHPEVFARLVHDYSNLEQDMRAISNEINHGRRMLQVGFSPVTATKDVPTQQARYNTLRDWYEQLNFRREREGEEPQDTRLDLLRSIFTYLPQFTDLPSPDEQLSLLDDEQKDAGMYGNREISPNMDENDQRWQDLDPSDERMLQYALVRGLISYDDAKNVISENNANIRANRQFLREIGNQLPENNLFDHTRNARSDFPDEIKDDLQRNFNNFMRLTFWHPNPTFGEQNLFAILQGAVKHSDSDTADEGYYKLPPEAREQFHQMSEDAQSEFLNLLLNSPAPITQLNPDARGNSGINGLIHSYSSLDEDLRTASVKGKHSSLGFNIVQDPTVERKHTISSQLLPDQGGTSPLQTLMSDLGILINPDSFDADHAYSEILHIFDNDPESLYKGHFPFAEPYAPEPDRVFDYIFPGNPLPDVEGEPDPDNPSQFSRDFLKREPKLQEMLRETGQKQSRHRTNMKALQDEQENLLTTDPTESRRMLGLEYNQLLDEVDPSGIDLKSVRALHKIADEKLIPEIENRNAYREDLRESIEQLENMDPVPVPNEQYEAEMDDYKQLIRDKAVNFLNDRFGLNITDLEEAGEDAVANILNNTNFLQTLIGIPEPTEYEMTPDGEVRTQAPPSLVPEGLRVEGKEYPREEQIAYLKGRLHSNAVNADQDDISDDTKQARVEADKALELLKNILKPHIDSYIENATTRTDAEVETDIEEIQRLAKSDLRVTRLKDFQEIIGFMKTNGVVASEASRQLGIPLIAKEQEFLNGLETAKPLIESGLISGDVASAMHGYPISTDAGRLNLNISFDTPDEVTSIPDGMDKFEYIKAIVNNHPKFQELAVLLNSLDIDLNLLSSSIDPDHGEHHVNLYNPERTRRTLVPFTLQEGTAPIHPLDGPLEQDEATGKWRYTGTLFPDIHELFSFINETDMQRILEATSSVDPETVKGEADVPLIVNKYVEARYPDTAEMKKVLQEAEAAQEARFGAYTVSLHDGTEKTLQPTVPPNFIDDWIEQQYPEIGYKRGGEQDCYVTQDGEYIPINDPLTEKLWNIEYEPDRQITTEDGKTYTVPGAIKNKEFIGQIGSTTKRSEFGLGKEVGQQEDAQYAYLKNIFEGIGEHLANPEVFAELRRKKAEQMNQRHQELIENEGRLAKSKSGLPPNIINAFTRLMVQYNLVARDAGDPNPYSFNVPDDLRSMIQRELPMFTRVSGGLSQNHLDEFLTNFYRQFLEEYSQRYRQIYSSIINDPSIMAGGKELGQGINQVVSAYIRPLRNERYTKIRDAVKNGTEEAYYIDPEDGQRKLATKPTDHPDYLTRGDLDKLTAQYRRTKVEEFGIEQFRELHTEIVPRIIDSMLSEESGKRTSEIGPPGTTPVPKGGTHIPISIEGILQEDKIPSLPISHVFPLERFWQGTNTEFADEVDTQGNVYKTPVAWAWFREQRSILEVLAKANNITIGELVREMMDDNGTIILRRIDQWLTKNGFVGNHTTATEAMYDQEPEKVLNEADRMVPGTKVTRFRGSGLPSTIVRNPAIKSMEHMRALSPGVSNYNTKLVKQYRAIQNIAETLEADRLLRITDGRSTRWGDIGHFENFFQDPRPLAEVGQDKEIQSLLVNVFGEPEDIETLSSKMLDDIRQELDRYGTAQLEQVDSDQDKITESNLLWLLGHQQEGLFKPAIGKRTVIDEASGVATEELFWDISKGAWPIKFNGVTGQYEIDEDAPEPEASFLSSLHARLRDFNAQFRVVPMEGRIQESDPFTAAEGQEKYFLTKDNEGQDKIISMPHPHSSEQFLRDENNNITGANPDYDQKWEEQTNHFNLLGFMRDLQTVIETLASERSDIQLEATLRRNPINIALVPHSLAQTIEGLQKIPLDNNSENPVVIATQLKQAFADIGADDYFDGIDEKGKPIYGYTDTLKPPTTPKDIATQVAGLKRYLETAPNLQNISEPYTGEPEMNATYREIIDTIESYVFDLETIMQYENFNIPDIPLHDLFQLGPSAQQVAHEMGIFDDDGNIRLFNDAGQVDSVTQTFFQPLYARRQNDPEYIQLTDTMLRNSRLLNPDAPVHPDDVTIHRSVMELLHTLKEYGEVANDDTLKRLFEGPHGNQLNIDALFSLMGEGIGDPRKSHITRSETGRLQLLRGRPQGNEADSHPDYQRGLLAWLHDNWPRVFGTQNVRPQQSEWNAGTNRIKGHLNSIIDRHVDERAIDIGADDEPTEGPPEVVEVEQPSTLNMSSEEFNDFWQNHLANLKPTEQTELIEQLNKVTHPEGYDPNTPQGWKLDENDFKLLQEALIANETPEDEMANIYQGMYGFNHLGDQKDVTLAQWDKPPPPPDDSIPDVNSAIGSQDGTPPTFGQSIMPLNMEDEEN